MIIIITFRMKRSWFFKRDWIKSESRISYQKKIHHTHTPIACDVCSFRVWFQIIKWIKNERPSLPPPSLADGWREFVVGVRSTFPGKPCHRLPSFVISPGIPTTTKLSLTVPLARRLLWFLVHALSSCQHADFSVGLSSTPTDGWRLHRSAISHDKASHDAALDVPRQYRGATSSGKNTWRYGPYPGRAWSTQVST